MRAESSSLVLDFISVRSLRRRPYLVRSLQEAAQAGGQTEAHGLSACRRRMRTAAMQALGAIVASLLENTRSPSSARWHPASPILPPTCANHAYMDDCSAM